MLAFSKSKVWLICFIFTALCYCDCHFTKPYNSVCKFVVKHKSISKTILSLSGGGGMEDEFENFEDQPLPADDAQFKIGKDRELFHLSLDLKWIWSTLFDKKIWMERFRYIFGGFGLVRRIFNVQAHAKEISIRMLSNIRSDYRSSTIKFFGGTLPQAQHYAVKKNRFLVVYVESPRDQTQTGSQQAFRRVLGDPAVGNLLNSQFVFYASSTELSSTSRIVRALGATTFPYFAVIFVSGALFKDMEVLAVRKPSSEIKSEKIVKFLSKVQEMHGGKLLVSKKERERMEAELALILQQKKEREAVLQAARESAAAEAKQIAAEKKEKERMKSDKQRRSKLLKSLPVEPESEDEDTVSIALRLASGKRKERRFLNSNCLEHVLQWADALGVDLSAYDLVTSASTSARRVYEWIENSGEENGMKKTLLELEFPKNCLLTIQKKSVPTGISANDQISL